ncbi:MAG: nicotinamidase-related amidase [Francisellaceae bacterium]|jgi:nicotinamidase-related amidase
MNKALILIEFQQEWLSPDGKLYSLNDNKERLNKSMKQAEKALVCARKSDYIVIHSGLSFDRNYQVLGQSSIGLRSRISMRKTFQSNSFGSSFHENFKPKSNELIVQGRLVFKCFCIIKS